MEKKMILVNTDYISGKELETIALVKAVQFNQGI
jgi:hypothetical protein